MTKNSMLDVAAVLDPPLQLFLALLKNATRTLETSKMESFATIVNGLKAANYCSKALHLKYLRGLAYTSAPLNQTTKALFNTYHFFPQYLFFACSYKNIQGLRNMLRIETSLLSRYGCLIVSHWSPSSYSSRLQ